MTQQRPAIFCNVPPLLVVLVVKALVTPHGVSSHLIWLFKVWSTLNFFSKIWCTGSQNTVLTTWVAVDLDCLAKSLRGRLLFYLSDLTSLLSCETTLAFPLPYCWSSSTSLYSSMRSISWRTLLTSFLVKDFLKSYSTGRPTLKVLIATSLKFLSILLNISKYLIEYIFRVSLSRIVIDNRESKSQGTLLQVTKRAQNALVSSLKELMEPSFKPSNHLIAIGPKLDGNTLHIRISFLEWTTILWLKWLTCSTWSVLPLYIVNVGWANCRRSFPPSILLVKGDLEICLRALLIASLPKPLRDGLLLLRL